MNQFDPLATPVIAQGNIIANQNTVVAPAVESVLPQQDKAVIIKQVTVSAAVTIAVVALAAGVYASLSHAKQVAAQKQLQKNSRIVVL